MRRSGTVGPEMRAGRPHRATPPDQDDDAAVDDRGGGRRRSALVGETTRGTPRAYFLTRAKLEADRAYDFEMGYACLNKEYDVPGMYGRLREHFSALARKYRLAASHPWLPVDPDPSRPGRKR